MGNAVLPKQQALANPLQWTLLLVAWGVVTVSTAGSLFQCSRKSMLPRIFKPK